MRKLLILILVLLSLGGCQQDQNKSQIEDTVKQYTTLLADGYRNLNMNPLLRVATQERATKAYHHMAALGEARIKMDAQLKDIKFLDLEINKTGTEKKAKVKTRERWDYSYINIDTEKPAFDNSVTYELTYTLLKKADKWVVADIVIDQAAEKKSSGDLFQRPPKAGKTGS